MNFYVFLKSSIVSLKILFNFLKYYLNINLQIVRLIIDILSILENSLFYKYNY